MVFMQSMKPLIFLYPPLSICHLTRTRPLLSFQIPQTLFSKSLSILNPNILDLRPFSSFNPAVSSSVDSLNKQMKVPRFSYGEIYVIVGPMFAGKTTALLHRIQTETSRSCCPNKKEDFINHQPMTMILHHCKQGNRVEIQFWEVYAYIWGFRKQAELTLIRHNMVQPVNLTSLTEHELSLLSVEVSGV
ncbi:uncharacterized protein LOC122070332 isoform X1 [Macadamia integrifolia]|uniref:uncharacterized protein LOC122070332 isoform X1 n=1 Tax=Macadamia integrifolia TaxID=60698 RepID=UPI001C4F8AB3|nr:uncharacterized protein LOC122070332 isoform X1 [Macadamia integrifolia]